MPSIIPPADASSLILKQLSNPPLTGLKEGLPFTMSPFLWEGSFHAPQVPLGCLASPSALLQPFSRSQHHVRTAAATAGLPQLLWALTHTRRFRLSKCRVWRRENKRCRWGNLNLDICYCCLQSPLPYPQQQSPYAWSLSDCSPAGTTVAATDQNIP